MRNELKIGIVVGIVIVVGLIIFVVNNSDDGNNKNQDEQSNKQPKGNQVNNQPPAAPPIEPPPFIPVIPPVYPPPVERVEVVTNRGNGFEILTPGPDKEVIPAVKEELKKTFIIVPDPEIKSPRYHTVKKGENLYSISEQYFGQGNQTKGTKAIQKANPDLIKNKNVIRPGWRLKIPYPEDITP